MFAVILLPLLAAAAAMPTGNMMESVMMQSALDMSYGNGMARTVPMNNLFPGVPSNTMRSTSSGGNDCDVFFYRVFVPGKMVYAWNCICIEGESKIQYVRGGARYPAVDGTETTLQQVLYSVHCFNFAYQILDLVGICNNAPGTFLEKTTPILKNCTDSAQKFFPGQGPPKYDRSGCEAAFSQARQEGMTMIASVWICQCGQPAWKSDHSTLPYVIDGRMPFAVPLSGSRPDVIDYMESCTTKYTDGLNRMCQSNTYFPHFGEAVQYLNIHCCKKANAELNLSLDCEKIATTS